MITKKNSNIKLSILICSLESRSKFLNRLLDILEKQKGESVEILINKDSGQKTIGEKRNELIGQSVGEYVCFIDDDDTVIDTYIEDVLLKINISNPDVIGFKLNYFVNGNLSGIAYHSLEYSSWSESYNKSTSMKDYYRNPNHLNPVKSNLAKQVMYPKINMGEDKDYSMRLLPLLKTQEYIDKPIYNYFFIPNK